MADKVVLTIMVALHCEAKPIIDAYKLKKSHSKPFDHYQGLGGDELKVELVVSGIGALAMAAAVGWVGAVEPNVKRVWLNVGTAGHATRSLGEVVLIHGAGDEVLQRCHYPALIAKWPGETDAVLSVSAPSNDYPSGAAVDMEAYAFFNVALRFSDSELVQSIKVISDNRVSGIEHLNAAKLTEFVSSRKQEIMNFINALMMLVRPEFTLNYDLQNLFELRGTHSQRQQVTQLLKKLQVMDALDVVSGGLTSCRDLAQVLRLLQSELAGIAPSLKSGEA